MSTGGGQPMVDLDDDELIAHLIERLETKLAAIDTEMATMTERATALKTQRGNIARQLASLKPPTPSARHACEACPRTFASAQGLAMHRTRSHKKAPAPTQGPRPAVPMPARPMAAQPLPVTNGGPVLRCTEMGCTFRTDDVLDADVRHLTSHTFGAHKRQPTRQEKVPVRA